MESVPLKTIRSNCWFLILSELDLVERYRLRLINKEFKKIIDEFELSDLFVCSFCKDDDLSCNSWTFTNDVVDYRNVQHNLETTRFVMNYPANIKRNLKRFKINLTFDCSINDFKVFEQFQSLEVLEFSRLEGIYLTANVTNIENLRFMNVNEIDMSDKTKLEIRINSPKLTHLRLRGTSVECIKLMNWQSIKHLEFEEFTTRSEIVEFRTKLDKSVNLETLKCFSIERLDPTIVFSILNLPKLVRLECHTSTQLNLNGLKNELNRLRELFEFLTKQRKVMRKTNLKIYLRDVLVQDDKVFGKCVCVCV